MSNKEAIQFERRWREKISAEIEELAKRHPATYSEQVSHYDDCWIEHPACALHKAAGIAAGTP